MSLHGERRKAAGATSALVASTRATDGRDGPGRGLSSLLRFFPADAQGEEDGRPRRVRRPTGTEDGQDSWDAAGASCGGCRAAGASSHGRLRGCRRCSSPLGAVAGWWRRPRQHLCPLALEGCAQEEEGGGRGEEGAGEEGEGDAGHPPQDPCQRGGL